MTEINRPIVNRFSDAQAVAIAAADAFVIKAIELLAVKSEIHISITGGTVGILTLKMIGEHDRVEQIDWDRVNIWWGDERFVDSDSPDRNANQAADALLDRVDATRLHEFPAADEGLSLDDAAQEFADHVELIKPHFDLTFLGMGPDGHICSLFPGKPLPPAGVSIIAEHDSPKPPSQRLSFTYQAVNASDEIWFLVAGADKADAVEVAFSDNPEALPVGRIKAANRTVWFVDNSAGAKVWGC
jgi:6-phosphogluconolactonase